MDTIGRAMLARILPHIRRWLSVTLTRPLTLREAVVIGAVLLTAGTIYCQIYCLLALQQMHGASMPLGASVHRASVDVVFAFAVFELGKRVPIRGRWWSWLVLVLLFAGAIALASLWRMQLHIMSDGLSPRRIAVDRIPFMGFAAAALAYFHKASQRNLAQAQAASDSADAMPPADWIDWIRAAGNYVEIRVDGRTILKRMTMAQAEQALAGKAFVRVHRSMLVNRSRIAGLDRSERPRHLRLADGSTVKIGEAYRANLD